MTSVYAIYEPPVAHRLSNQAITRRGYHVTRPKGYHDLVVARQPRYADKPRGRDWQRKKKTR